MFDVSRSTDSEGRMNDFSGTFVQPFVAGHIQFTTFLVQNDSTKIFEAHIPIPKIEPLFLDEFDFRVELNVSLPPSVIMWKGNGWEQKWKEGWECFSLWVDGDRSSGWFILIALFMIPSFTFLPSLPSSPSLFYSTVKICALTRCDYSVWTTITLDLNPIVIMKERMKGEMIFCYLQEREEEGCDPDPCFHSPSFPRHFFLLYNGCVPSFSFLHHHHPVESPIVVHINVLSFFFVPDLSFEDEKRRRENDDHSTIWQSIFITCSWTFASFLVSLSLSLLVDPSSLILLILVFKYFFWLEWKKK